MGLSLSKTARKVGAAAMAFAIAAGAGFTPSHQFSLSSEAQAQPAAVAVKLPSQMATGECVSREAMLSGLNKENQFILVAGDAVAYDAKTGAQISTRQAFTANQDFSKGYYVEANPKGELCKTANLGSVKLFNANVGRVDTRAYFSPINDRSNGTLNKTLDASFTNANELPMYQATTDKGKVITVTGNTSTGAGSVFFSYSNGKLLDVAGFQAGNVKYSQAALETLNKPQQTASLDLNR